MVEGQDLNEQTWNDALFKLNGRITLVWLILTIQRPSHERGALGRLDDGDGFKATALHFASEAEEAKTKVAEAKEEVAGMKRKLKEEEAEMKKMQKQLVQEEKKWSKKEIELDLVRAEKKREHELLMFHKATKADAKLKTKNAENPDQLRRQLEEETRKNIALTTENEMLRGLLEEKEEDIEKLEEEREEEIDMMDPKDRRRYKPEVVEYVWGLLKANVAHHQVPEVIRSSLKFFGKRANSIPSTDIVNDMAVSCLPASQKHMKVTTVVFFMKLYFYGEA